MAKFGEDMFQRYGCEEVKAKVVSNDEARKMKCHSFKWITHMGAQEIITIGIELE